MAVPFRIIGRTIADWWRNLIVLSLVNFLWLALLLPIVTAPAATAALCQVAWHVARHEGAEVGDFALAFRQQLLRSVPLFLFTILATAFIGFDVYYYVITLNGGIFRLESIITWTGVYLFIIWLQFIGYCWAHYTARPDIRFVGTLKNAAILTLRFSGSNLIVSIFMLILLGLSIFPILLVFVTFIIAALIMAESLIALAPELVGHPIDYVSPEEMIDPNK